MATEIRVTRPSLLDERYSFRLPSSGDPMKAMEEYFPIGWAVESGTGVRFWPGYGSSISCLPKADTYFGSAEAAAAALAHAIDSQSPEDKAWDALNVLVGQLSPENLSCDGELPAAKVRARRAALMREWAAAEKVLGRRVTEDEVWKKFYP